MNAVAPSTLVIVALLTLTLQSCASAPVRRGAEVGFRATAYCDHGTTKSGVRTREGILAADPARLPIGSVVRIVAAGDRRYEGVYTVMDTGLRVRGRRIDLYIPDCREARAFGVRDVRLEVVRLGWNPQAAPRR